MLILLTIRLIVIVSYSHHHSNENNSYSITKQQFSYEKVYRNEVRDYLNICEDVKQRMLAF